MHTGSQSVTVCGSEEIKQSQQRQMLMPVFAVPLDFCSVTRKLCNGHVNASSFFSAFPLLQCRSVETTKITLFGYIKNEQYLGFKH